MGTFNGRDDDGMANFSLENRTVFLLVAVLLGMGGTQVVQRLEPELVRADPFTGQDGKDLEERIKQYVEVRLYPHDQHLQKSDKGWELIYEMHEDIAVMKHQLEGLRKIAYDRTGIDVSD